jgi:hypothetical protein
MNYQVEDPIETWANGKDVIYQGSAVHMNTLNFSLRRVRLNSGGYDSRGRYFGIGAPLFRYVSEDGSIDDEIRGKDREDAKDEIRRTYPHAKFHN